jgi:hypothetical protein
MAHDQRTQDSALCDALAMRDELATAATLAALAALHLRWLDAPALTTDPAALRDDLLDAIRDHCYWTGVHVADVLTDD